jgi:Polyketide cyclase / dehydrase and lipid transport
MRAFRYQEHFEQSRDEIFAFMMDFRTAPRWRNLVRSIEVVGGGPMRKGATMLLTMEVGGNTIQVPSEVWAYEPPHRYGHWNTTNGVSGKFEYRLEPDATGTNVFFIGDIRPHGWMWFMLPWILQSLWVRYRGQLATLKRAMETQKV